METPAMRRPTGIRHYPWHGEEYAREGLDGNGLRLMIVAESHYSEEDAFRQDPDATTKIVRWLAMREDTLGRPGRYHPFFRRLQRLVEPSDVGSLADRRRFWQRIAFYNYVQRMMWNRWERPTSADLEEAAGMFRAVLTWCRPDLVLITSRLVWRELHSQGHLSAVSNGGSGGPTHLHRLSFGEQAAMAVGIPHPMWRRFRPVEHRPAVAELLAAGASMQPSAQLASRPRWAG
jgi:hypothetical protein